MSRYANMTLPCGCRLDGQGRIEVPCSAISGAYNRAAAMVSAGGGVRSWEERARLQAELDKVTAHARAEKAHWRRLHPEW